MKLVNRHLHLPFSLRLKWLFVFSIIFASIIILIKVLGFYGIPQFGFDGAKHLLERQAFEELSNDADVLQRNLQYWIDERKGDLLSFTTNLTIRSNVRAIQKRLLDQPGAAGLKNIQRAKAYKLLEYYFTMAQRNYYGQYRSFSIIDTKTSQIIFSTDPNKLGKFLSKDTIRSYITKPFHASSLSIHDHQTMKEDLFFTQSFESKGVFKYHDNQPLNAILVGYITPDNFLNPLLHTGKLYARTKEIILVDAHQKIIKPLKYKLPDGKTARVLSYQLKMSPAALAIQGQEGMMTTKDYRGVKVLAAFRTIRFGSSQYGGLIVKSDVHDIYYAMRYYYYVSFFLAMLGILCGIIFLNIFTGKMLKPIDNIIRIAALVKKNDFSQQVEVTSSDELGFLSNVFNDMLNTIQNWKEDLEHQIHERTQALTRINTALLANQTKLKSEIKQRIAAQDELKHYQEHLERLVEERTKDLESTNKKLNRTLKQLKLSTQQIIQSEKMATMGMFAAGVAHELNNPLMGILNYVQYCLKETDVTHPIYIVLQDIENETKRIAKLVSGLLTFSRSSVEENEQVSNVDIQTIVDRVLSLVQYHLRQKSIQVTTDIPPEFALMIKPNAIQQSLLNLLLNAIDAVETTSLKEIKIHGGYDGDHAIISVIDTGVGIPKNIQKKIFEPFFTTKPAGQGSGLGLSIVEKLVAEHGGQVICQSEPGKGATFSIILPILKKKKDKL